MKVKDSPVKKIDFNSENKENMPVSVESVTKPESTDLSKPITEIVKTGPEAPKVAPGIKPNETDEPILQENPHRFVLFPIKYHEIWQMVRAAAPKVEGLRTNKDNSTRKLRLHSGLPRRLTCHKTWFTGTTV